jgi:hypothetical protein
MDCIKYYCKLNIKKICKYVDFCNIINMNLKENDDYIFNISKKYEIAKNKYNDFDKIYVNNMYNIFLSKHIYYTYNDDHKKPQKCNKCKNILIISNDVGFGYCCNKECDDNNKYVKLNMRYKCLYCHIDIDLDEYFNDMCSLKNTPDTNYRNTLHNKYYNLTLNNSRNNDHYSLKNHIKCIKESMI